MIKKVGIITMFYNSSNYGGILQAYALVKILDQYGIKAEQIRYDNFSAFSIDRRLKSEIRGIIYRIKHFCFWKIYRGILKRKMCVVKAAETLVPHSAGVYTEKTISKCLKDYDIFITGSDQVWHGEWPAYFLSFVNGEHKKIAYAVSTGKSRLSDYDINRIKEYANGYTAVSVRETDTFNQLKTVLPGLSIKLSLDPTLLLNKSEWEAVASRRLVDEPYLFCYFLGSDVRMRRLAKEYAVRHGLLLVSIPHMQGKAEKNDIGYDDLQMKFATPQEFLSLIEYADVVFTDSFHAAVFSTIFQRQYVIFGRMEHREMNNRIETLTKMFGTQARFIDEDGKYSIEVIENMGRIDYECGNSASYDEMKQSSIDFLLNAIRE